MRIMDMESHDEVVDHEWSMVPDPSRARALGRLKGPTLSVFFERR